jgi:hypothetical protein
MPGGPWSDRKSDRRAAPIFSAHVRWGEHGAPVRFPPAFDTTEELSGRGGTGRKGWEGCLGDPTRSKGCVGISILIPSAKGAALLFSSTKRRTWSWVAPGLSSQEGAGEDWTALGNTSGDTLSRCPKRIMGISIR